MIQHNPSGSLSLNGAFHMCDHNDLLYTEDNMVGANNRAFVCAFRSDGEMLWSTQYGYGQNNAAHAMCASNDKVWMVGYSFQDWTFEEYVPGPGSDYFREVDIDDDNSQQEATIARFDIPLILDIGDPMESQNPIITIFPNPSNGEFILTTYLTTNQNGNQLLIYDMLGKLVYQEKIMQQQSMLNLSRLSAGCYQLVLQGNGFSSTSKWVKQ